MGCGSVILSHAAESVPQAGSRMTAESLAFTTLQTSKTAWDGGSQWGLLILVRRLTSGLFGAKQLAIVKG